jgi:hypothetical protein
LSFFAACKAGVDFEALAARDPEGALAALKPDGFFSNTPYQ